MNTAYAPDDQVLADVQRKLSLDALRHIAARMVDDPRLAWLIGPGSEAFDQITGALASLQAQNVADVRSQLAAKVTPQPLPPIASSSPDVDFGDRRLEIDPELYARMELYNDHVHDMSVTEGLNHVVGFFLERGVKVVEDELKASGTGELF